MGWEVWSASTPYNPDLSLSDSNLCESLKESIEGQKFEYDEQIQHHVCHLLQMLQKIVMQLVYEGHTMTGKNVKLEGNYLEKNKCSSYLKLHKSL
jgi:hypothetical protein